MERQSLVLCLFGLTLLTGFNNLSAQLVSPPSVPPPAQSPSPSTNPPAPAPVAPSNSIFGHFEDMNNLTPEERRAKMLELRQRRGLTNPPPNRVLSPEERRAKLDAKLAELRRKKANGTLNPVEERQLHGLEIISQQNHHTGTPPQPTNSLQAIPAEAPK